MHTSDLPRPTVLILGAGFGGLGAARRLRKAEADVVVVDSHDYHTFQPMLYQVATDLLEPSDVAHPVRDLFHDQPNAVVHQATASAVDLTERRVSFEEMDPIDYDYLVLALGARAAFFGVEGAAEHSFPMYTLDDAVRLKAHILRRWEAADRDPSLVEAGALDVVVVGGGPTGVETIGALSELYRSDFAKDYPKLPVAEAKLTLVEAGGTVFSMFEPELQEYTKDKLEEWGVEVALGEVVTSVSPTGVTLESGRTLDAQTLVWGAGLEANPIAESLGHGPAARRPHPGGRGSRGTRAPRGDRGGRHRLDPRRGAHGCPASARIGGASVRRGRGGEPRAADRRQAHGAVPLPRQGHHGDHRPRRGRRPATARQDAHRGRPRHWLGGPSTWRCYPPARIGPRPCSTGRGPGSTTSAGGG